MGRRVQWVTAGIDVSAATLSVAVRGSDNVVREYTVSNDDAGHRTLCRILKKDRRPVRVAMEATGNYHFDLAMVLAGQLRIEVMVVNPKAARKFAEAQMRRAKTDRVDAHVLLEFLERMEFTRWLAPSEAFMRFRILGRHLTSLIVQRVAAQNRLHAARAIKLTPSVVIDDIQDHIDGLSKRIDTVQAEALATLRLDADLLERFNALVSIPGVADRSGIQILAELATLPQDMTPDEVVAHAGLDPRPRQTGNTDPRRGISRVGNPRLRGALYMPAVVAAKHSPAVTAWYHKLLDREKLPLVAQVAVMRRLLRVAWVLTVRRQTWSDELFRPRCDATRMNQSFTAHPTPSEEISP